MNKVVIGIIVLVVGIASAVGVLALTKKDDKPAATNSQSTDSADSMNMKDSTEGSTPIPPDTSQAASSNSVEIKDYAYTPVSITVKKGTKVTWTNQDSVKHDITPDSESDAFKGSELLAKGASYEFTFNTAGTYTYHCSPHPYMKGTVVVTE